MVSLDLNEIMLSAMINDTNIAINRSDKII